LTNRSKNKNLSNCKLLACNCENSFSIDANQLARDLNLDETPHIYSNLCRSQLAEFEKEITSGEGKDLIVTCTQEAPLFQELASEAEASNELTYVNIREQAGWSKHGNQSSAKIAALIAEASYEVEPTGLMPVTSNGNCIVYGAGQETLEIAGKLSRHLNVSVLLSNSSDVLPTDLTEFPIYAGTISSASGSIGNFEIAVNNYAAASPSSKGEISFASGTSEATIETDLIFDMSGGQPLIGRTHGRDGYFNIDPANRAVVAEAMFEIIDLVGEFEKPIFVSYDKSICAHSRSGQTGCSNCIDNCPTSAITSDGDGIQVDSDICDGCGHCSSSCPTGAIAYAMPNRQDLIGRGQILLSTYLAANGRHPVILLHESNHGSNIISAIARHGEGLGTNVLPLSVHSINHISHDALCAFFTAGAQSILLLSPQKKRDEMDTLIVEVELANTFLQGMGFNENARVSLLVEDDPDQVSEILNNIPDIDMPACKNFSASKNKRETARLAIGNLNDMAGKKLDVLDLPPGAPYGIISIDTDKCTLCLACVGACPANALGDNEDRPQVSFTEHACVQCGLCKTTCPESAISLQTRYNFDKSALSPVVLNEEEPLNCSECGKPFGSKSAIDRVIGILQGKNPMFQTSEQMALLKMCENCRIEAMAMAGGDPMKMGQVPRVMTADSHFDEDDEPTRH